MRTIKGTNRADQLFGSNRSDLILGLGGSDTIQAGTAPFSILNGGAGDDVIFSGTADDDLLVGARGGDEFHLGSGRVSVYAGRGEDNVLVGNGDEFLLGGAGDDTLRESGPQSAYTLSQDDSGYTHIVRNDGSQGEVIERGFENLVFQPEPPPSVNPPTNNGINPPPTDGSPPPPATGGGGTGGGGSGGDGMPTPPMPSTPSSTYTLGSAGDLNPSGGIMVGDGTTPGDRNFSRVTSDQEAGPSVDFGVVPHQDLNSDAYAPVSSVTNGNTTSNTYMLPAGNERIANGSPMDVADREATDFIFGFEADTLQDALDLGDTFELSITTNTGSRYTGHLLAVPGNPDAFLILGDGFSVGRDITDNGGNASGTFNAEQGTAFGGSIPRAGDTAQVNLDITDVDGVTLAALHNTLNYV